MEEIWNIFKETESHVWEVSNLGNVRKDGIILEQKIYNDKYYMCCGKFVHRLVAMAFIPNPENKPYVDHIDNNKLNNNVNNLAWVTSSENCRNPITYELNKQRVKKSWTEERKQKYSILFKELYNNYPQEKKDAIAKNISLKKQNKATVTKDNKTIQINRDELIQYLENGYVYGYGRPNSKQRVYKNNKMTIIDNKDVLIYLKNGYKLKK